MLKKTLCLFLIALLLSCGGCAAPSGLPGGEGGTPAGGDDPASGGETPTGPIEFVYEAPTAPSFAVPDNVVQQFVRLVKPFNTCLQEFTDPGELTDTTLFFAAAGYLDPSFIASGDNYTYTLPLDRFPAAVRTLFGASAAFSDRYTAGSYEPYAIDGGAVVKYGTGGLYLPCYTFAVVPLEDGYELWLLDLMDDNVLNDPALAKLIEFGEDDSITWSMLEPFWQDMQTNVYTLRQDAAGSYYIAGFRYVNYKGVEHYMI